MCCEFGDIMVLGQSYAGKIIFIPGEYDLHPKDSLEGPVTRQREDVVELVHALRNDRFRNANGDDVINVDAENDINGVGGGIVMDVDAGLALERVEA
jgi:hypothetical protein